MNGPQVAIVGAGPGDPELLTLKGRRLLERADAVVHDRLVSRELLDLAPAAVRYDVGKVSGGEGAAQDAIDELLVRLAQEGKRVVRLKGGDPFVFGRSGSELDALVAAGISFEIVPGVTASIAAPAYAGVPVTDRRFGGAFVVVSAAQAQGSAAPDWEAIARIPTIVILMGAARAPWVAERLLMAGVAPSRPALAVEWGTTARQRVVTSTLGSLAADMAASGLGAPSTIVVGEVAALSRRYRWFVPPLTPSQCATARPAPPSARPPLRTGQARSRTGDTRGERGAVPRSGRR